MKMKNFAAVFLGGTLLLLFLTACGSKAPNEKTILKDFNNSEMSYLVINNEEMSMQATNVEVEKSQIEKGTATYWCVVEQSNYYYSTTAEYILPYVYYDKGGWMLENPTRSSEPEIKLLSGVSEEFLTDTVSYLMGYYESTKIAFRGTNLVEGTDEVVLDFTGSVGDFRSDGQITVLFTFIDNEWVPRAVSAVPAKSPITEQTVYQGGYYRNPQLIDRITDLENMTDTFRFMSDEIYPNAIKKQTIEVVYNCDNTLLWVPEEPKVLDESLTWTIEGDWVGQPGLGNCPYRLVLTVHSVSEDSITASLSTYDKSLNKIDDVFSNKTLENTSIDKSCFEFTPSPCVVWNSEYFRVKPDSFHWLRYDAPGIGLCEMKRG